MSYTKFGEFMRIKRVQNHEVMGDTAKLLGVTIPFVSAVENGKRNVPKEWIDILTKHYDLTEEESKELNDCVFESRTQVKLDLKNVNDYRRKMALQLQRSFDDMDNETAKSILELLKKEDD